MHREVENPREIERQRDRQRHREKCLSSNMKFNGCVNDTHSTYKRSTKYESMHETENVQQFEKIVHTLLLTSLSAPLFTSRRTQSV